MPQYEDTISETMGVAEATPVGASTIITDLPGVAESLVPLGWMTPVTDDIGASALVGDVRGVVTLAEDTVTTEAVVAGSLGYVIALTVGFAETLAPGWRAGVEITDAPGILAQVIVSETASIGETIGVTEATVVGTAITVLEGLGIEPTEVATALYGLAVSEGFELEAGLANFFGAGISETIGVAYTLSGVKLSADTIAETVGIAEDTLTPSLIVKVTVADEVGIEPAEALQMLYAPEIVDGVEISAAYLSPGDGFTTWVMNTRTGAVTEYDNFVFNSFASIGNIYLGAASDGLYALIGDNDFGTDIVAQIKSGFSQFGGARFSRFKAIYLGVRGEGDFVLKLITGDGDTYNYAVSTRDMRSTKVHIGKGLRARYFRFELISTGQDFDFESIEFVPLVVERRV